MHKISKAFVGRHVRVGLYPKKKKKKNLTLDDAQDNNYTRMLKQATNHLEGSEITNKIFFKNVKEVMY